MKIVFLDDKGSQSSLKNMIAIAIQISFEFPYRNFMLSVDNVEGGMQRYFKPVIANRVAEEGFHKKPKGIEYLVKRQIEGMLGKRDFEEAFVSVVDYHLYYLPSDDGEYELPFEERVEKVAELANKLEKYGDVIFINAGSYMNAWSTRFVEEADLVVINMDYSDQNLEDLFVNLPARAREKCIFIMSEILDSSIGNKRIKNSLRITDSQLCIMPENVLYNNAYFMGTASDFLRKNNRIPMNMTCKCFVRDLRKIAWRVVSEKRLV